MTHVTSPKEASASVDGRSATQAADAGLKQAVDKGGVPSSRDGNGGASLEEVQERYQRERAKRLRADGDSQYIDVVDSDKFRHFQDDPFAGQEPYASRPRIVEDGARCEYLVMGAGFAGLIAGVRLVLAGINPDDIWMVDGAGGFGGTWYWNRYPGLMCDLESYLYLPFLEETGYMPKTRYAYGHEIRGYINLLADKYGLRNKALFLTETKGMKWDEEQKRWRVTIHQQGQKESATISSRFVFFGSGVLHFPKIPDVSGLEEFGGKIFHTSRWDYDLTGGTETAPDLTKLADKNVAIVGTGATAVQAVPELAKWAKKLYVVQRTPSAVDCRGQKPTDPDEFRKNVANGPGWQESRHKNFISFIVDYPDVPKVNQVDDAWTTAPSLKPLLGTSKPPSMQEIPAYIAGMNELDFGRQERIRQRVAEVVKDAATAQKLQAWYPSWCKRPTFHDDYLTAFNRSNVQLLDTNGKGLDALTRNGIVVAGVEHPVDLIIMGTGYRSPGGSVARRAGIDVVGRNGRSLDRKTAEGWNSLHAVLSRDFPNLFLMSMSQFASTPNYTSAMAELAKHAAYIVTEAAKRASSDSDGASGSSTFTVEPEEQAERDWGDSIARGAVAMAPMVGCTPGYYNAEGAADARPGEQRAAAARGAIWGEGYNSLIGILEAWRAEGKLRGLEVTA